MRRRSRDGDLRRRVRMLEAAVFPKAPRSTGPLLNEATLRDHYANLRAKAVRFAVLRVAPDLGERAVALYGELGGELRAIVAVEQSEDLPAGGWELAAFEPARVVGRRIVRENEGPIIGGR